MTDNRRPVGVRSRTMATSETRIEAEAYEWTKRVHHQSFNNWEELDAWLEVDLRHAEIFNRLVLLDDEVAADLRELRDHPIRPAQPPQPLRPGPFAHIAWRRTGLMAVSVALIAGLGALGLNPARRPAPGEASLPMIIATRPGERRDVRLADGTQVAIAGGTRLLIDSAARRAELYQGQATFRIVHDPARPFTVRLGEGTVVDVGTIFDLRRRDGRNTVAVAQGEVRVDGVGAPIQVAIGQRLRFGGGAAPERDAISPAAASGWQRGRFNYIDAPVSDVVADIAQATGAQISAAPQIASRRFSGVVAIQGDAGAALRNVAPAMGLTVARRGDVWMLNPAHDPS